MKNNRGFAALEALLIIIIVAIVGFTGWYVWHSKQTADQTLNNANKSVSVEGVSTFAECEKATGSVTQETYPEKCVTKDGKTFTGTAQTSQQQYITIKEWGVRAPYLDSLDLSYSIDKNGNAEFSAKQLDDLVAGSDVSCTGYAGWITRYSADQHINSDNSLPTAADAPSSYGLVHVGTYYYQFVHAQSGCVGSLPSTLNAAQQAQLETLLTQANNDVKALTAALQPIND